MFPFSKFVHDFQKIFLLLNHSCFICIKCFKFKISIRCCIIVNLRQLHSLEALSVQREIMCPIPQQCDIFFGALHCWSLALWDGPVEDSTVSASDNLTHRAVDRSCPFVCFYFLGDSIPRVGQWIATKRAPPPTVMVSPLVSSCFFLSVFFHLSFFLFFSQIRELFSKNSELF